MISYARKVKDLGKRAFLTVHRLGLVAGVVILPNHYYTSVPDIRQLKRSRVHWARRSELPGIVVDLGRQISKLRATCSPFRDEYADGRLYKEATEQCSGPGYGPIEAQALYAMLRYHKPRAVIEIGCGLSTYVIQRALSRNRIDNGLSARHVCIEPNPTPWLRSVPVELFDRPVQTLDQEFFDILTENDFLFIDSSHNVKTGSDVNFLFLEVLPRLKRNVICHIHDIYLPFGYSRDKLDTFFDPQETALLQAFLLGNVMYEIIFCMSMIHYADPAALQDLFPLYDPETARDGLVDRLPFSTSEKHFPSSIYIRRTIQSNANVDHRVAFNSTTENKR